MNLKYIISPKTNGANPFAIFEALGTVDSEFLNAAIRRMAYQEFLKTAFWFGVASVAKSRAGRRCQVCNSGNSIAVHHRTYDTHGREHDNMADLVVLCENCHGLFHGHMQPDFVPDKSAFRALKNESRETTSKRKAVPHSEDDIGLPPGDTFILTRQLISKCRANGAFTNATLRAFGVTREIMTRGWPDRLVGKQMSRIEYRAALEGRFFYNSGRLQ